jgi:UDP-N-acetylglucosamine 2-epimerase (non-hydrolysing)
VPHGCESLPSALRKSLDDCPFYAELLGIFLKGASLPESEFLDGICGQPRHARSAGWSNASRRSSRKGHLVAVLVQGHSNTASAVAQAGNYAGAPVVHVDAGLRSYDRAIPEELNRYVMRVLADLHCAPTGQAVRKLQAEGVQARKFLLTDNTIVEATQAMAPDDAASRALRSD